LDPYEQWQRVLPRATATGGALAHALPPMKVTEPVDRGLLPLLCLLMPAVKVTAACNKGNNAQQQLILILLFCRSASLVSFLPLSDLLRYSASSLLCFRQVGLLWVSSPSPLFRMADRAALLADGGSVAGCGRRCWLTVWTALFGRRRRPWV